MWSNGTCGTEFSYDEWFKLFWIVFHASFIMVLKMRKYFLKYFYNLQENVKMSVMVHVNAFMQI